MPPERRDVLRLGTVGLGGLVAGCLDNGGADFGSGDATPTPEPEPDEEPTPETDPDEEPDEPTLDEPTRQLVAATDRVLDEIEWFATEYEDAMDAYVSALDRAIETVLQLENTTTITEGDIERLEDVAEHVEVTIQDELEPHFRLHGRVSRRNERAIERVERFGERGDRPAVNDELESLRSFYEGIRGFLFRQRNLSRDPIRNRLVEFLSRDDIGGDIDDILFEFRYRNGESLSTRAYTEDGQEDRDDPNLLGEPAATPAGSIRWSPTYTFTERFEPMSVPQGRRDELALVVNDWEDYDGTPVGVYTDRFHSWPVYIQRYHSPAAAETAASLLVDGPVFLEADWAVAIGDIEWRQARYRLDGDVIYAPFKQFGPYIITLAPSRTSIEDREGRDDDEPWTVPLDHTWLHIEL
ncbi:uncharacterized protein NP_3732A [Natronomonas pharaonis DSM 2160]|uniref:Uncharacterized protein n=1 Tax=Natronomonas pharaonis (strain ATCC 35678 / DSM 2160 / CIP 103997 / JCM 8858 / NBRC 14720 / NCIMB 2260 / Gabara) TaxID=348780 RepID=A0A1U7EXM8_NATPD|nr:hypothetical protein [Natronomonas pharaonis]CAI49957.1 uncharacterized protein NP_3732A [Natronomonas pharaonis DSM 2160]